MGASQSSPRADEKVFVSDTSLHVGQCLRSSNVAHLISYYQFSEDVVHQLVDHQTSSDTPHERQLSIDAHIRARIQSELCRLYQEEERVREEIERALEKENLDCERRMAGEDGTSKGSGSTGSVKSSAALMDDLEELRQKVEKYRARQNSEELSVVRTKGEEVVLCYEYVLLLRRSALSNRNAP